MIAAIATAVVPLVLVFIGLWVAWEVDHAIEVDEYGFPLDWDDDDVEPDRGSW